MNHRRQAQRRRGARRQEIQYGLFLMFAATADIIARDTGDPGSRLFLSLIVFLHGCTTVMRALLFPAG